MLDSLSKALLDLARAEAHGWRWRLGPSACADPVTLYVGHVWRVGQPRVIPMTDPTLPGLIERMAGVMSDPSAILPGKEVP